MRNKDSDQRMTGFYKVIFFFSQKINFIASVEVTMHLSNHRLSLTTSRPFGTLQVLVDSFLKIQLVTLILKQVLRESIDLSHCSSAIQGMLMLLAGIRIFFPHLFFF